MRRHVAGSVVVALGVTTGTFLGCSTTRGPLGAGMDAAANRLFPVEQEVQMGQQMSAEAEKELKLSQDPQLVGYVRAIGERLVAAAGDDVPAGIQYRFNVVEDDATVNAFAMPGGHVYIYTGLLRLAESEAEVAGVMGHEIAHVTRRHIAEQLVAQYGLQTIVGLALGREPGILGQLASAAAGQGFLLKYSRDHEREADYYGIAYEAQAGWNPEGFVMFFQKMEQLGRSGVPTFLLTHPEPGERIENAQERIAELGNVPQEWGRERYRQMALSRLGPPTSK
jgi:beta-barrel assembly-enhancing protease